jgi:hypothetical protein
VKLMNNISYSIERNTVEEPCNVLCLREVVRTRNYNDSMVMIRVSLQRRLHRLETTVTAEYNGTNNNSSRPTI